MGLEEGVLTHFAGTYPTCTCNPLPLLNKELARGWNAWFAPVAPAVRRTGFAPPDGGLTRRHTSKKSKNSFGKPHKFFLPRWDGFCRGQRSRFAGRIVIVRIVPAAAGHTNQIKSPNGQAPGFSRVPVTTWVKRKEIITMTQFQYTIKDAAGIHARPAGMLVKAAAGYTSTIKIEKGGKSADLKRLFALMGLAVKQNDVVTVTCDGRIRVAFCL